jgi:hypothetical protein
MDLDPRLEKYRNSPEALRVYRKGRQQFQLLLVVIAGLSGVATYFVLNLLAFLLVVLYRVIWA